MVSLEVILRSEGYTIKCYNQLLRFFKEYPIYHFKLIFLSISIDSMTGFEVADTISKKGWEPKICFLSDFKNYFDSLTNEYGNLDYKHFLQKPIKDFELVKKTKELLGY
jgi:FixJ family two-component response regulator